MNTLEETTFKDAPMLRVVERGLSDAIRSVLLRNGLSGTYLFNVRKDGDTADKPAKCMGGGYMALSFSCSGSVDARRLPDSAYGPY